MRARFCGQLSHPKCDGSDGDNRGVISRGLFIARSDASELLELAEAAFDEVSLGIEMFIERVFLGARRIVGNDGERALVGDRLAKVVGVIGGVGHDDLSGQAFDQGSGLRDIAHLARREQEAHGASQTPDGQMDFGAQATARAADGLILSPPFAPLACWWARTMVESTIRYSKSGSSDIASKIRRQTPL